jgi:hypothetical protein
MNANIPLYNRLNFLYSDLDLGGIMKNRFLGSRIVMLAGIVLFALLSCKADYVWNTDLKDFVDDGLSIPLFSDPSFGGSVLPAVNGKQMFQIDMPYTGTITVTNPKKLALNYRIRTDKPELFSGISGDVVSSGSVTNGDDPIVFPFTLLPAADKNDISLFLDVWNDMRTYVTPSLLPIRVNTRPSQVSPLTIGPDLSLVPADDTNWVPAFNGNRADVYWDYQLTGTNTDISRIEIISSIDGTLNTTIFNLDAATGKFDSNSHTVTELTAGCVIGFTAVVYDDENLSSPPRYTVNSSPVRAPAPELTRGIGNDYRNKVLVTALGGTTLYVKEGSGAFVKRSSPYIVSLLSSHEISAYTEQSGVFDSTITATTEAASYKVTRLSESMAKQ